MGDGSKIKFKQIRFHGGQKERFAGGQPAIDPGAVARKTNY
jgi:hypothetical protein